MHHFLPSNDQVSPKPETRVSQTETSPTDADAAFYTGSSKDCCDSYGSSIPFQNLGYAGLWGLESTSPGFAFSPSQTPTDLVLDDPFASSCNGQTTPEMTSSSNDLIGAYQQKSEDPASAIYTANYDAPSPDFSSPSSCPSLPLDNASSAGSKPSPDPDEHRADSSTEEESSADPPYSLLIYQALKSAPGMKLPLQGIYNWFENHTAKGKDQNSKGWQNSIRHNLSMNAGFEAVKQEPGTGRKAVNYWRLTEKAIENGIQSTTRFRKQTNYKRGISSDIMAPQRQRSGAKGGKALRTAVTKHRHEDPRKDRFRQRSASNRQRQQQQQQREYNSYSQSPTIMSKIHASSPLTPMTNPHMETFDLGNVVGCAETPAYMPIFYDIPTWADTEYLTSLDDWSLGWCGIHTVPNINGFMPPPELMADLPVGV